MGLTINPLTLLELFQKRMNRSQDQVCDYLDLIAEEANSLARIWKTVTDEVITKGKFNYYDDGHNDIRFEIMQYSEPNNGSYLKLQEFYQLFTLATTGKLLSRWQEPFIHRLSMMLRLRELTLERYKNEISRIKRTKFINSDNDVTALAEMQSLVYALQKEAASIEVLAKTIRVAIQV